MFQKRLEIGFLTIIVIAIFFLIKNNYDNYKFQHDPISNEIKQRIYDKEKEILSNMRQHYGFVFQVPIVITNKIQSNLYGLTSFENGTVAIYLNKNVMKESLDYMIDDVLPHEYAHALLFKEGFVYSSEAAGHNKRWQQTCIDLGGKDCEQFVNHNDVVLGKLPF